MSGPPSSQTTPQFYRVSDRDLTEIELHSVESISDLHRTHPEHSHKGMRPPRPPYTPSANGNLQTCDLVAAGQRAHPVSSKWQSRLQDMLTPSSSRAYAMGCAIITLLLLTVLLIFYFLAGQCDPDADRGREGERGCSHRADTADSGTTGTETQPDGRERGHMRKIGTENRLIPDFA